MGTDEPMSVMSVLIAVYGPVAEPLKPSAKRLLNSQTGPAGIPSVLINAAFFVSVPEAFTVTK